MKRNENSCEDLLKLDNQICFPLYAASRLIIRKYRPLLEKLGITYPQYLVLMILWEHQEMAVKDLGLKLYLDSGTLTPLLKRLEASELIERKRSVEDERHVIVSLTSKGADLKSEAASVPKALVSECSEFGESFDDLKRMLYKLIETLE